MERKPVDSSNISEVGYDGASQTLEIMFKDGKIYQYFDVPEHIYQGLINPSDTPGKFFHSNVRGVYRYARL